MNGARIICDAGVTLGSHCLISWNVVLMDSYRVPRNPIARRAALERLAIRSPRRAEEGIPARPVRIGHNVWIGFDVCVLPGVTIGDGAIVGARSVVHQDVPPFAVVAGNPARVIRFLNPDENSKSKLNAP
jgi:acetyltransferase-like isoleucine patch superfamily enzyme